MVGRLMPCSPGSRVRSGLPRPANWMMQSARLGSLAPSRQLGRSNDGQDHTVLPYARLACSPHDLPALSTLPKACWRDEPDSAARPHAAASSQGLPALPAPLMPTLPRPPQARLAIKTTTRSPLKDEPGWATHTPFPNFGKVEYFEASRLTQRLGVSPDDQPKLS